MFNKLKEKLIKKNSGEYQFLGRYVNAEIDIRVSIFVSREIVIRNTGRKINLKKMIQLTVFYRLHYRDHNKNTLIKHLSLVR